MPTVTLTSRAQGVDLDAADFDGLRAESIEKSHDALDAPGE
jgi:hypothetical protein